MNSKRWIESSSKTSAMRATKFPLLPEGEGRDEGEGRLMSSGSHPIFVARNSSTHTLHAMTLLEVLVVCAVLAVVAAIFLPEYMSRHQMSRVMAERIQCVNNLKQTALSFRVWPSDPAGTYPMQLSTNRG